MKIVLLPGFPDFTNLGSAFPPKEYFRGVPEMLKDLGFEVFVPHVGPFGTAEERGPGIAKFFREEPVLNDGRKAHIIAHSAGGLDARFLVSPQGMGLGDRVRSITMISTPHRGTPIADLASGALAIGGVLAPLILAALNHAFPNLSEGVKGLTTRAMTTFNERVHDAPGVEYFSYGGILTSERIVGGAVFALTQPLFAAEGANDGWVSVRSAHWREFKGTIRADHAEEIGYDLSPAEFTPLFGHRTFDHLPLYRRIASDIVPFGE